MNAYPTIKTWMSWEIQSGNFAPLCEWCISSGGRGKCCILCFIQEEKRGKKASRFMEKCRVRRDNKATDAADTEFCYSIDGERGILFTTVAKWKHIQF